MVNWLMKLSIFSWAYYPSLLVFSSCWVSYYSSSGMFGLAFCFLGASGGTSSLNFFAVRNFCFFWLGSVGAFEFPCAFDYCCNFLLIFVILLFFWKSGCWSSMQASEDADGLKTAFPALEFLLILALSFGFSSEFLRLLEFDYYIFAFYFCVFYNLLAF